MERAAFFKCVGLCRSLDSRPHWIVALTGLPNISPLPVIGALPLTASLTVPIDLTGYRKGNYKHACRALLSLGSIGPIWPWIWDVLTGTWVPVVGSRRAPLCF